MSKVGAARVAAGLVLGLLAGAAPLPGPDALIEARSIGPAVMSGRISDVEVVLSDPRVIFVGSATGGAWKSSDAGATWVPIFDDVEASSVGSIAVFQRDPRVMWIGTGEGNPRNNAGMGQGVFGSRDGGRTWTHLGLARSERIHRIVLDPADPDRVYVGAMGSMWRGGGDRGVYRTLDGGRTWTRVLFTNGHSGVADLVIDPSNPRRLFAAMWEYRRWPWFFRSGGMGSGLFVSEDGGDSWRRLGTEAGLPAGPLGRMGLAIAPSDPKTLYLVVEGRQTGLYRTEDGGKRWQRVNTSERLSWRPFYYSDLRVDPRNRCRLYILHIGIDVSEDCGQTLEPMALKGVHFDHQDLWISPTDPDHLLLGNDGGLYISRNRGSSFSFVDGLPVSQFDRVAVDMAEPYNVYGGLQDNFGWMGPSSVWEAGAILSAHWRQVMRRGDGMTVTPDPRGGRYGYSAQQNGFLRHFDLATGEERDIRPAAPQPKTELRFGWDAAFTATADGTIYLGSQFVHRSRDAGERWAVISPDLTTDTAAWQRQRESGGLTPDVSGGEAYTTISVIAPSPVDKALIWTGSDDGLVHQTTDDGRRWRRVTIPGRHRPGAWVADIVASAHDRARAYVVLDDHRRGDNAPYVYRTTDSGKQWIALDLRGVAGFAHTLLEDAVEPRLLFLGTELGLYVSLDGGERWRAWRNGVPPVPVRELVIHPREHDLVVATHGRGVFIVDDITPLRALARAPDLIKAPLTLFPPLPAIQHTTRFATGPQVLNGSGRFEGENRPYGALVSYWSSAGGPHRLVVRDENGQIVRQLRHAGRPGLNRLSWDLRAEPLADPWGTAGPLAVPGDYTLELTTDAGAARATLTVRPDPQATWSPADVERRFEAMRTAGAALEDLQRVAQRAAAARRAGRDGSRARELAAFEARLLHESAWNSPANVLGRVYDGLNAAAAPPTEAQLAYLRFGIEQLDTMARELEQILRGSR